MNMDTEIRAFLGNKRRKLNPETPIIRAESVQRGVKFNILGHGKHLKIERVTQEITSVNETEDDKGANPRHDSIELDLKTTITQTAVLEPRPHSEELPDRLILVAAGADLSLRVISYPIHADINRRQNEVAITTITGTTVHHDNITALAVTHRTHDTATRNGSKSSHNKLKKHTPEQETILYIASSSQTGAGLIAVHSVQLEDHIESGQDADHELVARHVVKCSAMGSTLAFKPQPAKTPTSPLTLLFTSSNAGLVKLYELVSDNLAVTRTKLSSEQDAQSALVPVRPLITLKADFVASEVSAIPRRKRITDAAWVSYGRAVLVILEDETYGVWDLEGVCPTATQNLVRGQSAVAGLTGGSTSKFAIKGSVKSLLSQLNTKLEIRERPVTKASGIFSKSLEMPATVRTEYDIGGLDQMLDSMEYGRAAPSHRPSTILPGSGDDMDIDMASSTLPRSDKSKLVVNKPDSSRQRLFG